ncbi:MAG: 1,3-propanediol dehydrogenase [Candidatus Hydrogenedentota bacterium]
MSNPALFDPFPPWVPTEILFGFGAAKRLPSALRPHGSTPFVVTGGKSARAMGYLDRIRFWFPDAVVFEGVVENPGTRLCDQAAALAREAGCDVVVAVGGGSPMDVAKAVAGLTLNPGLCQDFFGADSFTRGCLPIVAIPTTAGSGSEVTPYAVIVDDENRTKRTISGNALFPAAALIDPEMTLSLPRSTTLATGLDALSQAMEGMVSKKAVPEHAPSALESIRLVRQFLPTAADNPEDRDARAAMMRAATLSGMIIAHSGTTLVHGMGYPLTLECGIPHGLANALLLGPVFRFNATYVPESIRSIAVALGVEDGEPAESVVHGIHTLLHELAVSPAARDHGFQAHQIGPFSHGISSEPYRFRNQVGDTTEDRINRFYSEAFEGI